MEKFKKVIGINILGGSQNVEYWNDETNPIRHYIMQDKNNPNNVINGLKLYQYSLGDSDLESSFFEGKKKLKDWLHLFKNAQNEKEVPDDVSDGIKAAYERLKLKRMPKDIKEVYFKEENWHEEFSEYGRELREKTIEKVKMDVAIKLLNAGHDIETIRVATDFSEDQINKIKDDLRSSKEKMAEQLFDKLSMNLTRNREQQDM